MQLIIDDDIKSAMAFMQSHIPASRLVDVAKQVAEMAPLLWGHYQQEKVVPLKLIEQAILPCDPHIQSTSNV